jgi:hypothetical protein
MTLRSEQELAQSALPFCPSFFLSFREGFIAKITEEDDAELGRRLGFDRLTDRV